MVIPSVMIMCLGSAPPQRYHEACSVSHAPHLQQQIATIISGGAVADAGFLEGGSVTAWII